MNNTPAPFAFNLGVEVEDTISGFKGIIRCRSQYLTGCNVYSVQCRELKDAKPADWVHFDEGMLRQTGLGVSVPPEPAPVSTPEPRRGGPITPCQQKTA